MIRVGVSFQMKDKGDFAPYTRDMVVTPISKDLCRAETHAV